MACLRGRQPYYQPLSDLRRKLANTFSYPEGFCGGCGTRIVFSPDSRFLYKVSNNGSLQKYDVTTFKEIKNYSRVTDDLTGFAISQDGKFIARSTEKTVTIWNESNADSVSIPAPEKGEFHEVVFTIDGKELLIGSDNNTAMRWNLEQRNFQPPLTGFLNQRDLGGLDYDPNFYWQSAIAKYVRFKSKLLVSRDGKTLIKGKFGTKVKRWDIANGKTVMDYTGHKKAVLSYDLSLMANGCSPVAETARSYYGM